MSSYDPGALLRLGRSVLGLGETIYDKVNQADAHSQYMQGMELLRKGVIDFNNGLATDQNPDGYLDKWSKASDQIFKQSTGMLKNQDALSALKDQWENIGIKQYETITGYQTQAKVNQTIDRTMETIDKNSLDNTKGNQDRKAFNRQAMAPLIATGAVNPDVARRTLEQYDKKVDMSAMEEGLKQIGQKNGWDYALSLVDNPDFTKFFPSLTPQERDTIFSKVETQARFQQYQQKKAIHDSNSKMEDQFFHDYSQGTLSPDKIDQAQILDEPGGKSAADIKKEWLKILMSGGGGGRSQSDHSTMFKWERWFTDMSQPHDPESVRKKMSDLGNDVEKLSKSDWNDFYGKLRDLQKDPNRTDMDLASQHDGWTQLAKDHPDQVSEIEKQHNLMNRWRSQNRQASQKEVQDQTKFFQDRVRDKAVDQAIDDMYKAGRSTGGGFLGISNKYGREYALALSKGSGLVAAAQAGDETAVSDLRELKSLLMARYSLEDVKFTDTGLQLTKNGKTRNATWEEMKSLE